jgi:hypothetical protein
MLYPFKLGSSITGKSCPNTSKLNPAANILNKVNFCYKFIVQDNLNYVKNNVNN